MRTLLPLAFLIGCTELGVTEESGTTQAIAVCPTNQWCIEEPPITTGPLLHGVWAVNAGDVFAVGDNGTILRRINNEWTVMQSGTTANLRGVWAASSSDVWAVGVDATILHFNGTAWSAVSGGGTADLDAVWGSGSNDVWLAGGSRVLRWSGSGFTSVGFGGTMLSVSGTGPNDVWVTGENTNLHHWTGTGWVTVSPGAGTSTYFAVLALANEVWVTDFVPNKESMRFTTKWAPKTTGGGMFHQLSALAANELWGVGLNKVGRWNGSSWATDAPFGDTNLWAVTTTPGHVWVVGTDALIAHRSL